MHSASFFFFFCGCLIAPAVVKSEISAGLQQEGARMQKEGGCEAMECAQCGYGGQTLVAARTCCWA